MKNFLKNIEIRFIKFLFKRYRYLRVVLEIDLPPEYIVSDHAYGRMTERFKCNDVKIKKIAIKAWLSKLAVPRSEIINHGREYRYYHGFVFIFGIRFLRKYNLEQKILITVYRPGHFDSSFN